MVYDHIYTERPLHGIDINRINKEQLSVQNPERIRIKLRPKREYAPLLADMFHKLRGIPTEITFEYGISFFLLEKTRPPFYLFYIGQLMDMFWNETSYQALTGNDTAAIIDALDATSNPIDIATSFATLYSQKNIISIRQVPHH